MNSGANPIFPRSLRRLCVLAAAAECLTASAGLAAPNDKASTSAGANVIVVERLSFFKTADLNFGSLIPSTTAGTVTVATDGSRTATGGVRLATGTGQPARFSGYGTYNRYVTISINGTTRTLTRTAGTETMTMDTFVIGSTPEQTLAASGASFRISSTTGQFSFPIGATLRVKANQTPGIYSGTFTLTLEYQ